jgi:hypothetical protein
MLTGAYRRRAHRRPPRDAPSARVSTIALIKVPVLGEVAADHDGGSGSPVIDPQVITVSTHEQHAASLVSFGRRAPTAGIADGGDHIRRLEFHVHRHGAAVRSVGMFHRISACFTHSDEQVSNRTRRGTHG